MTIRLFLLDDHEIVRRGIRELLETEPDIRVVGEAGSAAQARRIVPAVRPDVAVLDARLPDGSGIDICREIRSQFPQTRALILTSFDDDEALSTAVLAGASGYLLKNIRGNGLIDAIRAVASGQNLLDPARVRRVRDSWTRHESRDPKLALLTPQERRILDHIAEGLTNRQIGEVLGLAEKTVKNYVTGILGKLGLERRTQAALYVVTQRDPRRP
ncbi:MAG: response regulator transcription factor [Actinomycetales bacterium]|nr:response regulator transcription factor [Actinomycetales bacterium]